jgi:hypothetical protein
MLDACRGFTLGCMWLLKKEGLGFSKAILVFSLAYQLDILLPEWLTMGSPYPSMLCFALDHSVLEGAE